MTRKLSLAIVFAMAVVLATAPFVLAQQNPSGPSSTPSAQQPSGQMGPTTPSTSGSSSQMGSSTKGAASSHTTGMDTIHATVADVNHQHNTLKLKMQGGETVEFKVPEASLAHLNKGDSVQVSIHKAEAHPSTTTGTQSSRPESSPSGTKTR